MAKYLAQANYTNKGLEGLLKEGGSGRREATEKLFASVGGKLESYYFAFGDTDLFVIADVPDNVTMAAVSLIVNSAGAATVKVTALLTPEEIDSAVKKTPTYRPPGRLGQLRLAGGPNNPRRRQIFWARLLGRQQSLRLTYCLRS